jgi:TRAP transporter T-component
MINQIDTPLPVEPNNRTRTRSFHCILKAGLLIVLVMIMNSGCRSLSPTAMMDDYFERVMASIASQEDAELVRQGVPTLILFLDASLAGSPDDPKLLLTTATAYTTYAQAFLNSEGEMKRAAVLYGRARQYGFRLLKQRKFFAGTLTGSLDDFEKALMLCKKMDVPDLYVTGNAWLGWILSQPDSMEALDELPKVMAIMQRVLVLDNEYADGGVHLMYGIYYAIRPPDAGRDLKKSRKHFRRAMTLSGNDNQFPRVIYAEFYLTTVGDEKMFDQVLDDVVNSRRAVEYNRSNALINAIARERAGKLLDNREDYF